MKPTFAKLGIPFPLYEGSAAEASEYVGLALCSLCGRDKQHCFKLGIGADVIANCSKCGSPNALDADDRDDKPCRKCSATVSFLPSSNDDELRACYDCLRGGKAALTKDTSLGMVRWEDAVRGLTHGRPGRIITDFELGPTSEDGWTSVKVPENLLMELVHTPTYSTIQREQSQFCCKQPMIYVGTWEREDFSTHAKDGDGRKYFDQIVQDVVPGLWEDELHDTTGIYVFRCRACNKVTAHWDLA